MTRTMARQRKDRAIPSTDVMMMALLVLVLASCLVPRSALAFCHPCSSRSFHAVGYAKSSMFGPAFVRGGGSSSNTPSSSQLHVAASSSPSTQQEQKMTEENLSLLSDRGRAAVERLIAFDQDNGVAQAHVYGDWPPAGQEDEGKQQLAEQLADLDESYPGGLASYLSKAKVLLQESADGVNPFSDFEARVPEGEALSYEDDSTTDDNNNNMSLSEAEALGESVLEGVVFCLVAGGLGERLGYSGIKLELETNLCTNACFLETYIEYILALQQMVQSKDKEDVKLPLVIMTSGDTDASTRQLLKDNDNFGMDDDQIVIVTQDKVAALKDGSAGLALKEDDRWTLQTKPHGHGDVHHLLHREGLVEKWVLEEKRSHLVFLQDTNALVINSIIPTLGVSVKKGFHMNSICIPRLAGEAAGAITRLEHKTDPEKSLVINVEYNQLDPLLQTQAEGGDVADETTGYSPFPGNANNLVLELDAYHQTLKGEDQGVVLEFVNPKYKDPVARTDFKKPTRLECMMQDIPKLFQKEMASNVNIGFTMFDRWYTFSPAKNALDAGVESVEKGSTAPGTMSSAESDYYVQNQRKLKWAGVDIEQSDQQEVVAGIPVTAGPRLALGSSFAVTQEQLKQRIQNGGRITQRSSLVVDGNVVLDNLQLDGALVIKAVGPDVSIVAKDLTVENEGWTLEEVKADDDDVEETVAIRGYTMNKKATQEYIVTEPGSYIIGSDGVLKKQGS
uniref:UTP-monosaccharide-1-phosphate uridylyltransferase n=1 Tax=Grammatophora oceanica TaxID=210454 RepID=A0A7S1YBI8_9STRA|eukprot:CAMPEP_0194030322 /NCGR_PEP_ID=MMETSP0009_2-20130614/3861_1 /TAXON_ID=210454 /ORGANISM="Grammatophora oceanica, Strain CCMP 410" /LENGTH=732 /DNA_ID=CAMNT_0038670257 /DNA_START=4 /DNA_END=2202 /DNA_ORIENTATION=+